MWAKIEVFHNSQNIIYLPSSLTTDCETATAARFGARSANTRILFDDETKALIGNSFERPAIIKISDHLRDELLIEESPIYQMKITDSRIVFGPVIGLLLGNATHRYNPIHMMKYSDRFGIYSKVGGLIYAFSPKFIHWERRSVYGLYYNYSEALWEYGYFPLPEVIYRRDFHSDPNVIRRLIDHTGGKLYNSFRFTKYQLYDFINRNEELKQYLPPTEYSNEFIQLKAFIDCHHKVILKPIHLSRGRGICIIEKTDSRRYKAVDFRCKHPTVYELYNDGLLENFFTVYKDLFDKYLVQKYLPLARIGQNPFDIRVVMQRRPDKDWGCTGIECRVSNNGYLTNISRGGYALPLNEALQQAFSADKETLTGQIDDLCRKICRYLDTSGEHFAEFGLDIAIDADKQLWLIEANVFPSFKGFKKMEPETYLSIRYTPMLYATSLTEFGEDYRRSLV